MVSAARVVKPDAAGVQAVDLARTALLESVPASDVGDHVGHHAEYERVVTHFFECRRVGYLGWRWSVTVARASRLKAVTIDEVVLLPGDGAIVAPPWVPYRERIQPGDLSPGDLLPTEDDDPRLVPGYLVGDLHPAETGTGDELAEDLADTVGDDLADSLPLEPSTTADRAVVREVAREVGLGRERVLSLEGREDAAQRWYDGDNGPDATIAQSAPGPCSTCGFLVRMAGPLSRVFGVCANAYANDDGRVVSLDHGCGAHSGARLSKKSLPQPLPQPVVDTLSWDDMETF